MDANKQKQFICFLAKQLREYHHELNAYRVTGVIAEREGFPFQATLETALHSEDVHKRTDQFFEGFQELIDSLDEATSDKALSDWLQKLRVDGKPN